VKKVLVLRDQNAAGETELAKRRKDDAGDVLRKVFITIDVDNFGDYEV